MRGPRERSAPFVDAFSSVCYTGAAQAEAIRFSPYSAAAFAEVVARKVTNREMGAEGMALPSPLLFERAKGAESLSSVKRGSTIVSGPARSG